MDSLWAETHAPTAGSGGDCDAGLRATVRSAHQARLVAGSATLWMRRCPQTRPSSPPSATEAPMYAQVRGWKFEPTALWAPGRCVAGNGTPANGAPEDLRATAGLTERFERHAVPRCRGRRSGRGDHEGRATDGEYDRADRHHDQHACADDLTSSAQNARLILRLLGPPTDTGIRTWGGVREARQRRCPRRLQTVKPGGALGRVAGVNRK
jgi:hypothetical protein